MGGDSDLLLAVGFILCAGMLAGHAGQRIGMPSAVGKICIGLLVGPAILGLVSDTPTMEALAGIGVVILMFLAGLETDFETMKQVSLPALAVAAGGVIVPFFAGLGVGYAFELSTAESLFLGAILTATSVSISADTLKELGLLQTKAGSTILAAAVIDDIMGVVVLAFVFSATGESTPLVALGKMALFIPLGIAVGWLVTSRTADKIEEHFPSETQLSIAIGAALAYAWAAEHLGGVAAVTGAYVTGVLISRTRLVHNVTEGLSWVSYSFFAPLFFASIGFKADFHGIADSPGLVATLVAAAVAAKVIGCYAAGRLTRMTHSDSLFIGISMMSRGEVALVIAAAGLSNGSVSSAVFSAAVMMTLITTILTPIVLKLLHARAQDGDVAIEGLPA